MDNDDFRHEIAIKRQELFVKTDKMTLSQVNKLVLVAENLLNNNSIRRKQNRSPISEPFNLVVNFTKRENTNNYYAQVRLTNRRSGASYGRIGDIVNQVNKYHNATSTPSTYVSNMRKLIVQLVTSGRLMTRENAISMCMKYGLNVNI